MIEHVVEGCLCEGKVCSKCPGIKCVGMFHRDKKMGRKTKCKVCVCRQVQAYYQNHAEERKAYSRGYKASHPEQVQQYNQQYYQDNREQEIARALAYWYAHPEQKEKHRQWLEENAEAVQAYSAWYAQEHAEQIAAYHNSPRYTMIRQTITNRRRTRVTQAGGAYTADEWEALKAMYDDTCLCCGKREPEVQLEADHVNDPTHERGGLPPSLKRFSLSSRSARAPRRGIEGRSVGFVMIPAGASSACSSIVQH